jgi:hypothetical protein
MSGYADEALIDHLMESEFTGSDEEDEYLKERSGKNGDKIGENRDAENVDQLSPMVITRDSVGGEKSSGRRDRRQLEETVESVIKSEKGRLRESLRKFSGIVMALFRKRLKNSYCNHNLRMQSYSDTTGHFNGWASKYQFALVKGNVVEYRVVARFESVKQVMRRYELFYELTNFAVNNPNGSFDSFLKRVTSIILSMYNGDTDKANEVLDLSKKFQKFINTGAIHPDIAPYL